MKKSAFLLSALSIGVFSISIASATPARAGRAKCAAATPPKY